MREQASLRRYFKALLDEFKVFGHAGIPAERLAERVRYQLPKTLQQDVVFELSGKLIAEIWRLQGELGETRTPLEDLQRGGTDWRGRLPLRLEDEIARALLNDLLIDAASVARGGGSRVRWRRSLELENGVWSLVGELQLPASLEQAAFCALFQLPSDDETPRRFDLRLQVQNGTTEVVAIGSERADGRGGSYLGLEHAPRASQILRGQPVARARSLSAREAGRTWNTDAFTGAASLSELPWVFGPLNAAQHHAPLYDFAGEGSTKVRTSVAFVAAPAGTQIELSDCVRCEDVGELSEFGRRIYRVTGRVVLRDAEGGRTIVETGVEHPPMPTEYRLQGMQRELGREGRSYFFGPPRLIERREDYGVHQVPNRDLLWKSTVPGANWQAYADTAVGAGRLRYVKEGEVRFSEGIQILPRSAEVVFYPSEDPSAGVVEFSGFAADETKVVSPPGLSVFAESKGPTTRLKIWSEEPPPGTVRFLIQWGARGELHLELPFPSLGAAFTLASGVHLPLEACVAMDRLPGVHAVVLVPRRNCSFFVEGRYRGGDDETLPIYRMSFRREMKQVAGGHFELDLAAVQGDVHERFRLSEDLEGVVRLYPQSNEYGYLQARLHATRFDLTLRAEQGLNRVSIESKALKWLTPEDVEALRLEILPLSDLTGKPRQLDRCGNFSWEVPTHEMAPGRWMIFGWHGEWCRVQPLPWDGRSDAS
jgi:hypothetical protein